MEDILLPRTLKTLDGDVVVMSVGGGLPLTSLRVSLALGPVVISSCQSQRTGL